MADNEDKSEDIKVREEKEVDSDSGNRNSEVTRVTKDIEGTVAGDDTQESIDQAPLTEDLPEIGTVTETRFGKVQTATITQEMQKYYLDYAMSVIVSRALPDVRDGLKPVHRRILFAMKDMGLMPPAKFKKCARVIGEVLGKYHPHSDTAVYDALVRMAQDFSLRYTLVDGQGNFGSIDGDKPAAIRYTECRLQKISGMMLADMDKQTVEMMDNFDATLKEPSILPAVLPNLLLNGSEGIAVGMATKIPPHNLNEVADAIVATVRRGKTVPILNEQQSNKTNEQNNETTKQLDDDIPNLLADISDLLKPDVPWDTPIPNPRVSFESDVTLDELLEHVTGPDFPTAGFIFDQEIIRQVYATGKGSIPMRGKAEIEEVKGNRFHIIITEIPYQVNKANLVASIADLVKDKKLEGISDLRDESDRTGMRVVVELKRDAKPKSVLNALYKHTQLQQNFPANLVALVDGTPQLLNLKQILTEYVKHRQIIIIRRSQFDLRNARYRAHILEGLKIALDHIDEIIETIKKSKDSETAKQNLMSKFGLSEYQSVAILDMQLRRLSGLERQKIEDEYAAVMDQVNYLEDLLNNPDKILGVITDDLKVLKKDFGDPRRTMVVPHAIGDFNEEDLIPKEKTIVAITSSGYLKRMSPSTFRTQHRGGKGVSGMTTKDADDIAHMRTASTHDNILFFTDKGRVFKLKVWEIPEGSRTSKGQAVINLLNIEQGEEIQSVMTLANEEMKDKDKFILLATRRGMVKKTSLDQFANIRTNGIIAIKLSKIKSGEEDQLVWAAITEGSNHVLMISHEGKSIRFSEKDIRPTGRDTMGVVGMKLAKADDYVVGMEILPEKLTPPEDKRLNWMRNLVVVMERGIGKQTMIEQFPVQKRGGQGVKVANVTPKTGKLVGARLVTEDAEQVVLTTKSAQVIKMPLKNVPALSRPAQGVILMRLKADDKVTALTVLGEEGEEDTGN